MGALTNKPMAFSSRNWEYQSQLIYDFTDYLTPRIRIDQVNGKVYRVLPTVEWISNRIRFLYLGLRNQRINTAISSYQLKMQLSFHDFDWFFEKKLLLMTSYQQTFELLKARLYLNKKKNVNVICGSMFNADVNFLKNFKKDVKVNQYAEIAGDFSVNIIPSIDEKTILLFVGVNPRMESPLLNLKIKETTFNKDPISLGNFSFSFPVTVVSNNAKSLLNFKQGFLLSSVIFFGISSLNLIKNFYDKNSCFALVPIYLFNSVLKNSFSEENFYQYGADDVNILCSNQNYLDINNGFNFFITSHFDEKFNKDKSLIQIPVASYLETSYKFLNKDFKNLKTTSLKPNFNQEDFFDALKIYLHNRNVKRKISKNSLLIAKSIIKIKNVLINNSIPNYLIRDPLGRANPLFQTIKL